MHGPFTASRLADFAARKGALTKFDFRGSAPLFQGQAISLRWDSDNVVQALRCDGVVAMEAKVEFQ